MLVSEKFANMKKTKLRLTLLANRLLRDWSRVALGAASPADLLENCQHK